MKLRSVAILALAVLCTVPATFKAADTIQIKGQLLSFDGKPMAAGCVYLNRNDRELLWRGRVRTAHMAWEHP
jgi:hypothetical protein